MTAGQNADRARTRRRQPQRVTYKVTGPDALDTIPAPDEGDFFFDFEGDPNWQDPATGEWGIEYLFGLLEHPDETFIPISAHSLAQERQAFTDFMEDVAERRRSHPGLHIYHYAPYEVTALKRLAARHGIYAAEVTELIDSGVLFDLLKVVRAALITSQRSFSINAPAQQPPAPPVRTPRRSPTV